MPRWTYLLPLAGSALAAACGGSTPSGASSRTGTGSRLGADASAVSSSGDVGATGADMTGSGAVASGSSSSDASGATSGSSGAAGDGSSGSLLGPSAEAGRTATGGTDPSMLPTVTGTCPAMSNLNGANASFAGQSLTVWSGDPAKGPGPLLIYWHATGSNAMEPTWAIQAPQIQRIVDAGGMVVAQAASTTSGQDLGDAVWYTGDLDVADEVVACAVQVQKIDVRRIWTAGYGTGGGFASVAMWYARSGYIAGAISYDGGELGHTVSFQDPSHVPVGVASHGGGSDRLGDITTFASTSHAWEMNNPSAFIIDCDDGGARGATGPRIAMAPQAVQMIWDHPYGITPEPYSGGLPAGWPTTCVPPPVPANH